MIINGGGSSAKGKNFIEIVNGTLTEVKESDLSGVTELRNDAFYGCTSLTSIEIPKTVETIGAYTFAGCLGLTNIYINKPKDSIEGAPWGAPDTATVHWKDEVTA